ncbi:MAG: DUF4058 family protein [Chloroflexales bacterium]|nr:DUF4058 family protein [Chloroflexales bacterium]
MPSPFPGMDPYLEGSEWTSVHIELSSEIARQLAPQVSPKYIVRPARRFVVETVEDVSITARDMYPGVGIFGDQALPAPEAAPTAYAAPLLLATVIPEQAPQVTVEIRDATHRTLVTAIEVLSLSNKRGEGYQEYLEKRARLLHSSAHLLEIDLLRRGRRAPMRAPLPEALYFIFLSRTERRPLIEVWPLLLTDSLPIAPVPLLPGDPDVQLHLQDALNSLYDALRYDLSIDYTQAPDVPLPEAEARWASALLRDWRDRRA